MLPAGSPMTDSERRNVSSGGSIPSDLVGILVERSVWRPVWTPMVHSEGVLPPQVPAITHPLGSRCSPSAASRAQLMAPARVSRSVATRSFPRVRARLPPQDLRVKWAILRSTMGRSAR